MPDAARAMIKTALLWLALGLTLGALTALFPGPTGWWPGQALYPSTLHLITVGWLTQLIFGVAYWLFPRWSRERPHGPTWVAWMVFTLLNAGLLLRLAAEPFTAAAWRGELLAASAGAQTVAGIFFAIYIWHRVKVK